MSLITQLKSFSKNRDKDFLLSLAADRIEKLEKELQRVNDVCLSELGIGIVNQCVLHDLD